MGFSSRTIFLFIRGIDQSGRAFNIIDKRIDKLMKKESTWLDKSKKNMTETAKIQLKALNNLKAMEQQSYRMMFAGAAFISFAAMMAGAIGGLISASSKGQLMFEDMQRSWEALSDALSERLLRDWEWVFTGIIGLMDDLSENEIFMALFSATAIPVTIALAVMGASLLIVGILGSFFTKILTPLLLGMGVPATAIAKVGTIGVSIAIPVALSLVLTGIAIVAKSIGNMIVDALEDWGRESGVTEEKLAGWRAGVDALLEHPILGGGGELSNVIKEFFDWILGNKGVSGAGGVGQTGHMAIGKTGPMMVHAGEMLFNPQLPITPPRQMEGLFGRVDKPIEINNTFYVDSIGTEA